MKTLIIALGLVALTATAASATGVVVNQSTCAVTWSAPQTNTNGTNLTSLAGYGVYVAATATAVAALTTPSAVVAAPAGDPPAGATAVWPCGALAPGQWFVQVDAVSAAGKRSARSVAVPFVSVDDATPSAPGDPVVTGP